MAVRELARGRSYCNAVESYDCEAPAGYGNGRGSARVSGVHRSELHTCAYCSELVCSECSDETSPPTFLKRRGLVRVCLSHGAEELADWLGLS